MFLDDWKNPSSCLLPSAFHLGTRGHRTASLTEAKGSLMRDFFQPNALTSRVVNNAMGFCFSGFGGNGKGWSNASISSPKWHDFFSDVS